MKPRRLILHHSATSRDVTIEDIRDMHLARGFNDIGYHLVIHGDATIHYGRDLWVQGAHDAGQNRESVGLCVVGNNTVLGDAWSSEQEAGLVDVMRSLRLLYGPIFGFEMHRENEPNSPTRCPGISDEHWASLLERVYSWADRST